MIVELKKGYTIESRYDKFSDSYITRLLDNESKQVGDALSSKDIVGKNQDIKSVRDYFTNYINNKRVEEEIPDEIDYIEPEEEFEEEEDIFKESLNLEDFDSIIKQKARKTKKATRKAKLPALSKMSPIMPDYTKSIDAFNSMQADGDSSMGSTTGSISLGEEFKDRNSLIKELQDMGFNYKFDKYSDKQLYRIYQERTKAAKKKEAEKREQQKASSLADHKKENAKDSYFRDGIEFESEDAAREYFGESMSRPYHWDVDEIERIILKAWEDADLRLRRDNIHISRHDNWCFVEIEYIDDWTFKHINKAWIKKTLKKELGLSEIKQSSWKNDGWGSRDYGKTLRYDMYVSDEQGMNESMDNKFYLNDMHEAWDIIDPEDEISIPTTHSNLNESFSGKSTKQFNTITEGLKFFENKCFDETCEDIQLESLFESMRDKLSSDDIKKLGAFMNHAQDADEVLTYMKGLLSEDLDSDKLSTQDLYALANECINVATSNNVWNIDIADVENFGGVAVITFIIKGDWKHDHSRFDLIAREFFGENIKFPFDVYEYDADENGDYDSDYYPAYHAVEIQLEESSDEPISLELKEEVQTESLNEARKPKFYDSMFAKKVIDAYKAGKLNSNEDIEAWEIEYNGGKKPNPPFNTKEIIRYYKSTNESLNEAYVEQAWAEMTPEDEENLEYFNISWKKIGTDGQDTIYRFEGSKEDFERAISEGGYFYDPNLIIHDDSHGEYARDIDRATKELIERLSSAGFELDNSVRPVSDSMFGGKHLQVINPDLYFPTAESEEEAYDLFRDYLREVEGVLDMFEDEVEGSYFLTYNFGANDKMQITGGIDIRPVKRK